jgi:uncharacterized protein DUF2752
LWSYSAARTEPAPRAEATGLFALVSLWLVYTRFFSVLQTAHTTLPACPFYVLTGHPCPFCGGTRAYAAMWRGDVGAAFRFLPLGPLFFVATFVVAGYAGWATVTGRRVQVRIPTWAWMVGGAALALSWSLKLFWLGN